MAGREGEEPVGIKKKKERKKGKRKREEGPT